MDEPLRALLQAALLYLLLPVWMLAGFGDWLSHRLQGIEHTAGVKESAIHLLMLAELGPCLLMVLLFEVNALVLALLLMACVAHELTVWWDLNYAMERREIPVVEQWLHSFQLAAPWTGLVALALLHWGQAQAVVGLGPEVARWQLDIKQPGLPVATVASAIAGGFCLVALPFLEEFRRCWKARTPS